MRTPRRRTAQAAAAAAVMCTAAPLLAAVGVVSAPATATAASATRPAPAPIQPVGETPVAEPTAPESVDEASPGAAASAGDGAVVPSRDPAAGAGSGEATNEPGDGAGDGSSIPGLEGAKDALGGIRDVVTGDVDVAGGIVGAGVQSLATSLLEGAGSIVDELAGFAATTTQPDPTDPAFLGGGSYATVASFSVLLLVGFIVLGVVHGVLSGDPALAVVRLARDVPLAVLAILGFPWLVGQLLSVCDALSAAVLPGRDALRDLIKIQVLETLRALIGASALPAMLISLLTYAATLLIYLELMVRVILLRLVEALAPLSLAPMVWPPARAAARKVAELTVAVLLSEVVIFVALREGLGFLEGHATSSPASPTGWGKLLLGLGVLTVAAFSPWVLWRLIPHAEAMLAAQGLSRGPFRGAMQTLQTAYWVDAVTSRGRLRRQGSPGGSGSGTGPPNTGGLGPARSLPPPSPSRPRRPPGGSTGGSTGRAAGAGPGGAAAGAAAAAAVAKAGKDRTVTSADQQSGSPSGDRGPSTSGSGASPGAPARPDGPGSPGGPGGSGGSEGAGRPGSEGGGSGAAPGWSRRKPQPPPAAPPAAP